MSGVEPFKVLFVCTGNTCRSPMAEEIARRQVADLGWSTIHFRSAGAYTVAGLPASPQAIDVARERGLDLTQHRSVPLSAPLVEWADLVLGMGDAHARAAADLGGRDKSTTLGAFAVGEEEGAVGEDVPDPMGAGREAYQRTFDSLERLIRGALARLAPILAP